MRSVWVAFLLSGFAALSGAASAADLPARTPAQTVADSWSGFYVGVNGGYGRTGNSVKSGIAGGQIGFNRQVGFWVFGAEADLQWIDLKTSGTLTNGTLALTETMRAQFYGTVRGRVGVAFDRALFYGTGGLAYINVKHDGAGSVGVTGTYNETNTLLGWAAGGGGEWMLWDKRWTAKVEYLYSRFEGYTNIYTSVTPMARVTYGAFSFQFVRAGLNYRF